LRDQRSGPLAASAFTTLNVARQANAALDDPTSEAHEREVSASFSERKNPWIQTTARNPNATLVEKFWDYKIGRSVEFAMNAKSTFCRVCQSNQAFLSPQLTHDASATSLIAARSAFSIGIICTE
jgi:hypothetical protein